MTEKPNLTIVKPLPPIQEPDLTKVMAAQEEFIGTFGIDISDTTKELYIKLVEEEHEEWVEEFYGETSHNFDQLKELTDLLYVTAGLCLQLGYKVTTAKYYPIQEYYDFEITELVSDVAAGYVSENTLRQLMYVIYGYADSKGWDLDLAYERVHKSNMSKLTEAGEVVRRGDGKVLKSEQYKEPYLEDLTDGK